MRASALAALTSFAMLAGCSFLFAIPDQNPPSSDAGGDAASELPDVAGETEAPATFFGFRDAQHWEHFAVAKVAGGQGARFEASASTGRFVGFLPWIAAPGADFAQTLLVFDGQGPFTDAASWQWIDTQGVRGGVGATASSFYLVPGGVTNVLRWNAGAPATAVEAHETGGVWIGPTVADGAQVYTFASTNPTAPTPSDVRAWHYDASRPVNDSFAWEAFDMSALGGGLAERAIAVVAAGAVYAFPTGGCIAFRYDTSAKFSDPTAWKTIRSPYCAVWTGRVLAGSFDGRRYLYLPTTASPDIDAGAPVAAAILRFDVTAGGDDPSAWTLMVLGRLGGAPANPLAALFDGRYVNVVTRGAAAYRYDTERDFTATTSWEAQDLSSVVPGLANYEFSSGTFDGEYVYVAPGTLNTEILRFHARTPRRALSNDE